MEEVEQVEEGEAGKEGKGEKRREDLEGRREAKKANSDERVMDNREEGWDGKGNEGGDGGGEVEYHIADEEDRGGVGNMEARPVGGVRVRNSVNGEPGQGARGGHRKIRRKKWKDRGDKEASTTLAFWNARKLPGKEGPFKAFLKSK